MWEILRTLRTLSKLNMFVYSTIMICVFYLCILCVIHRGVRVSVTIDLKKSEII